METEKIKKMLDKMNTLGDLDKLEKLSNTELSDIQKAFRTFEQYSELTARDRCIVRNIEFLLEQKIKDGYKIKMITKEDVNSNPETRKELQASMDTKLPELRGNKE